MAETTLLPYIINVSEIKSSSSGNMRIGSFHKVGRVFTSCSGNTFRIGSFFMFYFDLFVRYLIALADELLDISIGILTA